MLEGTVARILNQLLGKYVQDLDTENLNVGIFSGTVQLSELKLKPEALYELGLPIEVTVGTIGKIQFEIPWTAIWNQPISVNIEDIYIVAKPVVGNQPFDPEKNKRLLRGFKKNILQVLERDEGILGGPSAFAEHLVSNILGYMHINITNIHVRYEDESSCSIPLSVGLCVGSITAENTSNKWKRCTYDPTTEKAYYLIKLEAVSVYCNPESKVHTWELPVQYYEWRKAMLGGLEKHSFEGEEFKFVLNPMTSKVKMTITKASTGQVVDINTDIIVQDCNVQVSKNQYEVLVAVTNNLRRMLVSWQFLPQRPKEKILDNQKSWWRYAYWATLEQRVRPFTWSRVKTIRTHYRQYLETYKQLIGNPHDVELKLDLQKHEDNLSVLNVVVARQHARLIMHSRSQNEKSFWSMLPSPEKIVLCQKIGYYDKDDRVRLIDHCFNFKLGNFSMTLTNSKSKEILLATVTQILLTVKPNFVEGSFKGSLKIEGIILEGSGPDDNLITVVSSEHLKDSPAFVFTSNWEKSNHLKCPYRLQATLNSMECIYVKRCFDELERFLQTGETLKPNLLKRLQEAPNFLHHFVDKALTSKWELNLSIKCPYFVIPEFNCGVMPEENVLVIDLGKYCVKTEICQATKVSEGATKMEMEEQLYSKLQIDCTQLQVIFCDTNDHWKAARNEKDTLMHLVPKTNFGAVFARAALNLPTIPRLKFNISCPTLKLNVSERKITALLKFFHVDQVRIDVVTEAMQPKLYQKDRILHDLNRDNLKKIQEQVSLAENQLINRKTKTVNGYSANSNHSKTIDGHDKSNGNMNEAWARTVDLPGLEDNVSPNNTIETLYGCVINEFSVLFSKSSDCTDRQYLMLRLGLFSMDVAFMSYGPAYQMSIHSLLLTDKLHTTTSGQYLDLVFTPLPNNGDVVTVLYRKVSANCPEFWTHFHGVETSLVANFGTVHILLHQESVHTLIKYSKYLSHKLRKQTPKYLKSVIVKSLGRLHNTLHKRSEIPVPPGSVKFSHSARMSDLNVVVCDSDFDIINLHLNGFELDFLFRANERFVFRSYLASINVEHLSQVTIYSKVLYVDEDRVFEVKYVRNANHIKNTEVMDKRVEEAFDGSFKIHLGRIHVIFLYKLMVQLQRFIINLEVLEYLESYFTLVRAMLKTATDTLKNKTKISLSINVGGPVFLIPQKSSSPNVLVIDTGHLRIENFFKESDTGVVENILVKLKEAVVTRGVMTLTSTLEMQETLVEPLCFGMDIKKHTNSKTLQKNWEIDSVLEKIEVTLGQKDLSMIMAIYTDNIGEAKLVDLLPEQIRSPISEIFEQDDDNVRELEAFFCEPKVKFLAGKCKVDEIKVMLFFDAGELLSSPIRDLNHGLCKLEINDIDASLVIYTDNSSDGKLSVDTIIIEEIGPDANVHSKTILGSPAEDGRNNNICNITVNKPPIVDVNFHQNKNGDRSVDVIVGRLCLSLSVPFCEKVALYVLECVPKDVHDLGIVNPGYEGDAKVEGDAKRKFLNSLTVSLRVNKPELMFLVETTSNKKRYFITKSEIMVDYSRHCNRLNLVTSLSGLHSLFYDLSEYSDQPYVVLKQCDVELSRNVDENGEKIVFNVSGLYVKICNEVVHSITDILNDIVEHFKVPDVDFDRRPSRKLSCKENNTSDLWEPKKMEGYVCKEPPEQHLRPHLVNQHLAIPKFEVVLIFELEQIQVLLLKSSLEVNMHDWSYLMNCNGEMSIQANYFNENVQNWEPVIDPVTVDEMDFRPWECQFIIFQFNKDKARYISDPKEVTKNSSVKQPVVKKKSYATESEDSGEDMVYLQPASKANSNVNRRVKSSLSAFLEDSDSENEEGAMEKLAVAISDLFTGDWNEHEESECEHSSEEDISESGKSLPESQHPFGKCLYILVNATDMLNFTVTPTFLKVFNELVAQYSSKIVSVKLDRNALTLVNDIGPQSRVELYEKNTNEDGKDSLVGCKKFEIEESPPNSPIKPVIFYQESVAFDEGHLEVELRPDNEHSYDFGTIQSLNFPQNTTADLYDRVNKHYLKMYLPGFTAMQTNCSERNWMKLVKLHSTSPSNYYLAAKHTIGRNGRQIVVSSPLQVRNETSFALNILYQPSVLQQMNIEPFGEVTNPFETTMRIAILEAHESFNVPLYIAYHCKLFVQPAYAEGHYASESGIWWSDMAREMDAAYNLICKPKNDSSLEIFALRAVLQRNLDVKNSLAHSVPNYLIRLLPPMSVQNFLPYSLQVENLKLKQVVKAEPGEKCHLYSLDLSTDQKFSVTMTCNTFNWTGHLTVTGRLDDKLVLMTSDQKSEKDDLYISVKCEREGSWNLIFYSPYWFVNKTGLPLKLKASHPHQSIQNCPQDDILLFSYKRHSKQTLNVKVYDSQWSSEFSAECCGTTGLVVCKDVERKKRYMLFMSSSLSNFCPRLTKIISILPSFLIVNHTEKPLRFMENNEKTDLWIDLEPGQTVTYWPDTLSMQIFVKYRESNLVSQAVPISTQHRTVLRMDKGTAIMVESSGGSTGPFYITFKPQQSGDCPVLIKNYCADLYMKIQQKDQGHVSLLNPNHQVLYTWDNPCLPRILTWNIYNNKGTGFVLDVLKDGYGEEKIKFQSVTPNTSQQESSSSEDSDSSGSSPNKLNKKVRKDKIVLYWACYVEGPQRILLFTQEQRVFENVLNTRFKELCTIETLLTVSGVGLSLFTSDKDNKEHLYASVVGSPAVWEVNVGQKWKTLTLELASWIEDKYKRAATHKKCQIKDYVHIDFEKMFMLKPFFAEIRRTYVPALSCHFKKSSKFLYGDFRLNYFQLDNRHSNSIVLQPILNNNGPDLQIGSKSNQSAFFGVNFLRQTEGQFSRYCHVKVDVCDVTLNIENDLWTKVGTLLKDNKKFGKDYGCTTAFITDITAARKSLTSHKPFLFNDSGVVRVDLVAVSGMGVQLAISNRIPVGFASDCMILNRILDHLFPTNMAPYMPPEGVHHRIPPSEWTDLSYTLTKTMDILTNHVTIRFLQQYYAQVLGLQVLVNTFERDIESTATFAHLVPETVLYGCQCILGHVAMSPAALETCILDVFPNFNVDYAGGKLVKKRGSVAVTPRKVVARAGKSFECAVPVALTQLFVKNSCAASIQCGEIFFKTSGKALYSLLTKHPDDKSDFVEIAREALQRAVFLREPIKIHQRLPRYRGHLGLSPFSVYDSIGHHLVETVGNSRFANDRYWSHVSIDRTGKSIVIVTLEHLIRINKYSLWSPWEVEWSANLDDIISLPKINFVDLLLNMRQTESNQEQQIRIVGSKDILIWLHEKIEQAIILSMEDKSWTIQVAE